MGPKRGQFFDNLCVNFGVHFRSDSGSILSSILGSMLRLFSEYFRRKRFVMDVEIELPSTVGLDF